MLIFRLAALALAAGVMSLSLKKDQPAHAFLVASGAALALLWAAAEQLAPALEWLQGLSGYAQGQALACLLRVLGIALAAQLAADACRDAGMAAAATAAELCGRALALAQTLPLLQSLFDSFLSFLQ